MSSFLMVSEFRDNSFPCLAWKTAIPQVSTDLISLITETF